jgi:hypothetical protein
LPPSESSESSVVSPSVTQYSPRKFLDWPGDSSLPAGGDGLGGLGGFAIFPGYGIFPGDKIILSIEAVPLSTENPNLYALI